MNAFAQFPRARADREIHPGDPTPWGLVDTATYIANGVTHVSTPSHSGFHLSSDRLALVPLHWRKARHDPSETSPFFEGDCDWCFVAFTFPDLFPLKAMEHAKNCFDMFKAEKLNKASA